MPSLNSGTITAIIFDSVKLSSSDARDSNKFLNRIKFKQIIAINGALWPISASLASLIGGFFDLLGYRITILITFAPSFLQLAAVLMIKEPEYSKLERKNLLTQIANSLKIVKLDKQLILLLLSGFLVYSFAEVAFQMKPVYLSAIFLPIQFFGIIFTLSFAFSFIGSILSERISQKIPYKTILISCQILIGLLFLIPSFIPFAFRDSKVQGFKELLY